MQNSFLEQVPPDVLQHVAFLGAASGSEPPAHLFALLATSRAIYDSLNIRANPHLYAAIFKLKYDDISALASFRVFLTDSSLAAELVQRCRALRRCFRRDMSPCGLRQDLWTTLCMLAEGDSRNARQLSEAGFPKFILELAFSFLRDDVACSLFPDKGEEMKALILWLLCLGLTRQDILMRNRDERRALLDLLRPFVAASRISPLTSPLSSSSLHLRISHPRTDAGFAWPSMEVASSHGASQDPADVGFVRYARICSPWLPPPSDAAIILTFALIEAVPLQIPFHLPATRAIAIATNRPGPTMEDYVVFQRTGTLLYSDIRRTTRTASDSTRSSTPLNLLERDPELANVLGVPSASDHERRLPAYLPGSLTGVWEGSLMISSCLSLGDGPAPAAPDFLCRTPLQCVFSEFFGWASGAPADEALRGSLMPHTTKEQVSHILWPHQACAAPKSGCGRTIADHAVDNVIIGQTLEAHEQAWGGFEFAGRVHSDGLIVFKRQPKHDTSETAETWVFEGHLRYGTVLIGTFRSASADGIQGIFSMRRRTEGAAPAA
ncbi:hypothetical protein B0H10DRAFT_1782218 [Mycena sp. CBHHK59/15]|nr:hypothetical protein B0H10DRAFT_1782218 [Mycena sp. CBHHK59/15]